jgi:hypothetical protein
MCFSHAFLITLIKKHMILTCQGTHVNLIRGLYEISDKPIYKKFLSLINIRGKFGFSRVKTRVVLEEFNQIWFFHLL